MINDQTRARKTAAVQFHILPPDADYDIKNSQQMACNFRGATCDWRYKIVRIALFWRDGRRVDVDTHTGAILRLQCFLGGRHLDSDGHFLADGGLDGDQQVLTRVELRLWRRKGGLNIRKSVRWSAVPVPCQSRL